MLPLSNSPTSWTEPNKQPHKIVKTFALKPDTGVVAMARECVYAAEQLATELHAHSPGDSTLCMPDGSMMQLLFESIFQRITWHLPSFIHEIQLTGSLNKKGLKFSFSDTANQFARQDYRVATSGSEEGIFGVVPGTTKKLLVFGRSSGPAGTHQGLWTYDTLASPTAWLNTGCGVQIDPVQSAHYQRVLMKEKALTQEPKTFT